MKIALISPHGPYWGNFQKAKDFVNESDERVKAFKSAFSGAGMGPLILAALTPEHIDLEYIDENVSEIDFTKKYDIVGISVITRQAVRAYEIANTFKQNHGSYIVMGGIHTTILPEEVAQHADTIVIGEGESSWPRFLKDFEDGQPQKVYRATEVWDLKDSPAPRYDLMELDKYDKIWIQTSRGCPHECEYCAASITFGSQFRFKTHEQVINELLLIKNYIKDKNVRIRFADDNLFVNRKRAKELLQLIKPLNIRWDVQSDISIADDKELLDLMHDAGCVQIFVGFESLSPENMESIDLRGWKAKKLQTYRESIEKIQSRGLYIHGSFIVGLDNDKVEVFNDIKNFILETNMFETTVNICTPLPGTKLRDRLLQQGRVLPTPWNDYTFADVNITHPNMTKQELEDAFIDFYRWHINPELYLSKMMYFKNVHKNLAREANLKRNIDVPS